MDPIWDRDEGLRQDLDKGWQKTTILTLFLTTLWIYIQGLTSLVLWWEVLSCGPPGNAQHAPSGHSLTALLIPTLTDWLTILSVGTCVYIISLRLHVPSGSWFIVHGLHPWIACFPVITLFTQVRPTPKIPNWWVYQRSICNIFYFHSSIKLFSNFVPLLRTAYTWNNIYIFLCHLLWYVYYVCSITYP